MLSRDQHLDHIEVHYEVSAARAASRGFNALPAGALSALEASLASREDAIARVHDTPGVSVRVQMLGVGHAPRSDGASV